MTIATFAVLALTMFNMYSQNGDTLDLDIIKGEYWWGGLSTEGHNTPYDADSEVSHDQWANDEGNQAQPILLSNKGRYVWSNTPIKYMA